MTREQFDAQVTCEHKRIGHHLWRAEAVYALCATLTYDAELENVREHTEQHLRDRLWHELYGARSERFHELLNELLYYTTPYDSFERRQQIIRELHECAPLEPKDMVYCDGAMTASLQERHQAVQREP